MLQYKLVQYECVDAQGRKAFLSVDSYKSVYWIELWNHSESEGEFIFGGGSKRSTDDVKYLTYSFKDFFRARNAEYLISVQDVRQELLASTPTIDVRTELSNNGRFSEVHDMKCQLKALK